MHINHLVLGSPEKTHLFGKIIGEQAIAGEVLCLDGDLGAGKTALTQAIAKGLWVPDEYYVTSPSFNIFHEYPGRLSLYHMDFYRLNNSDEVIGMGLDEYFYMAGLVVIEWAKRAKSILPEKSLFIDMKVSSPNSREIVFSYSDDTWERKVGTIIEKFSEGS